MPNLVSFRPDFRTHILSPAKVVFYSDSSNFLLSNEIFVQITCAVAEKPQSLKKLTDQLIPKFGLEMANRAVAAMFKKGFLIQSDSPKLSDDARAFWYENGLDAERLYTGMKNKKITVRAFCGDPDKFIEKLINHLTPLGFCFSDDEERTVVLVDDYLNTDFDRYIRDNKKACIPIKFFGSKIWLGPVFSQSEHGCCWECVKKSLKLNRRVEVDLFNNHPNKLGLRSKSYLTGNEDLAFRLCAIHLAKWLMNPSEEAFNQLFTFDLFNFQANNNHCGLIRCESCLQNQMEIGEQYEFKSSPIVFYDDNGPRSAEPENTFEELKVVLNPVTGIVPKYKFFQVNNDYVASSVRNLPAFDEDNKSLRVPDVAVGKGKTKLQAMIGCLAESVERYNSTFFDHPHIFSKYENVPHKTFRPEELLLCSDAQYENRDLINSSVGTFNQIPKKYCDSEIRWTKLHSLEGKESAYFPTSYCFLNYPHNNEIELCPGDTNGCASGNTIEEAIVYAILELIERDAVAIWWYNKIQRAGLRVESISSPSLHGLIDVHRKQNKIFHLIDITSDFKIPTFLAISADQDGNHVHFGSSSHFDPIVAMTRAVHELNQMMVHTTLDGSFLRGNTHPTQKEFAKWLTEENLKDHPHLNPHTKSDFIPENYTKVDSCDFLGAINDFNSMFRAKGLCPYWLNLSQVNIRFFTVKVIVPGLRHFWNRLGAGRLYDIPVELGLIPVPLREEQMNKIPYFL